MRIYVYDGDDLVARIYGDDEAECVAIFDLFFGTNDYTWDRKGDDLCAVDQEPSGDDPDVVARGDHTLKPPGT